MDAVDPENPASMAEAWLEHATAVEQKLDTMARLMGAVVEQADPARYPDPFAAGALAAAVTWTKSTSGGTVDDLTSVADRLEAWLRRPRGSQEPLVGMAARSCPECRVGKHGNCDGTTWDDGTDARAACPCAGTDHVVHG